MSLSQLCHPNISFSVVLFSFSIRVFSNELVLCIRWLKYWSFSFSISPASEYLGLISFRMDWFVLVAVQGTLNSFLNIAVQKHQFFGAQSSLWSNSLIHTWLLEKWQLCQKWCLCFLICCLGLSQLFFQGVNVFEFLYHRHHLQWF